MAAAMGVVRIPLRGTATLQRAAELRERLLDRRVDAPVYAVDDGIWLRISAHAYPEIEDHQRLAEVIRTL
jgi:hypothetical protein